MAICGLALSWFFLITTFQKIFKKNSWLGEKEEQVSDEFDSEEVWDQIVTQRRKRGYVDYSVLEM